MLFPIKDYNPTKKTAYITIILIIINIAVFLYQGFLSEKPLDIHIAESAMVPYEITHFKNVNIALGIDRLGRMVALKRDIPPLSTVLTSIFMHGSIWHLLGNMLFLWIFGNNIGDFL